MPLLYFISGLNNDNKIRNTIPTCKPDTAKICITPAFENCSFVSESISSRLPKDIAEIIALFLSFISKLFSLDNKKLRMLLANL